MPPEAIRIGTSGWSYPHWRDRFYPHGLSSRQWLEFYERHFSTVEINTTFYRLPASSSVQLWRQKARPGFCYAAKGSRYITHLLQLKDCRPQLGRLLDRLAPFAPTLGVMLWQLPPTLERDDDRLEQFLSMLPERPRAAFEFRHPSWDDSDVYELLARHKAAYVCASSQTASPKVATTDFVYVRFHGLEGGYAHDYTLGELQPWADWLRDAANDGRTGYVFFNNDGLARAPENARRLQQMLGDVAFRWPGPGKSAESA